MTKGSIQPGIVRGKVEVCPACGAHFVRAGEGKEKSGLSPLFCPNHPNISPSRYRVMFGNICHHHHSFQSAHMDLVGLLYKYNAGEFDARDYQIKAKPLSFNRLAEEWLDIKKKTLRPKAHQPVRNAMEKAVRAWGESNIKSITYAHVEDFLAGLTLAPKTKKNTLDALKQFWAWAVSRYDIAPMKSWPNLGHIDMKVRRIVTVDDQELILAKIAKTEKHRPRVWLAIKWLATYISIRPGEMLSLTEGQIDRNRGVLTILPEHAKEHRLKVIPLLDQDFELLERFPPDHPSLPFFRHEEGRYADQQFGPQFLWKTWKTACAALGIEGVDLYGGTKHSTATALRQVASYEEVRKATGHTTNKAFDRYLRLEGEAMKGLYAQRQNLLTMPDNALTISSEDSKEQVIKYFQ